jgi:hypothetical protein
VSAARAPSVPSSDVSGVRVVDGTSPARPARAAIGFVGNRIVASSLRGLRDQPLNLLT